jgi:uncharacterized protein with NAD-binding domain and iron-sulfur cluster
MKNGKKKIAILGGGIGALSAAFGLTEKPNWRDEYEIDVYELGWRLGGKGASGRNAKHHQRIEEHGLHVWGGYYENAFRVMRDCYAEMGRPAGAPLATIEDAFKKQSFITVEELFNGQWLHWFVEMPTNENVPWKGGELPTPWAYLEMAMQMMLRLFARSRYGPAGCLNLPAMLYRGMKDAAAIVIGGQRSHGQTGLHQAIQLHQSLHHDPAQHDPADHERLIGLLNGFMDWLWRLIEKEIEEHTETRRLWIGLNIMAAHIRGMVADGAIINGFGAVEDIEWSEWMLKHGADRLAVDSPMTRCIYNTIFGFSKGDTHGFARGAMSHRAMSAQSVVHGLFRFVFTYKGAIFWEMQAGMGDTVFTPLYQTLKKRGVNFHFFSRVKNLGLSADKTSIATISIGQQVTLKTEEYQPLVRVKDLDCWPSEPHYCQIVEGEELKERRIDLYSAWTSWQDVDEKTLECGVHFDEVVLGISLAALKDICPELIAAREDWQNMVEKIETVQTQAVQLWLRPDAAALGWKEPPTMLTTYVEPLDTWADLSHLIQREDWPAESAPGNLAYFCGPMEDPKITAPFSDHEFPKKELDRTKRTAAEFFNNHIGHLWPMSVKPGAQGLNWDLLVNPTTGDGVYFRANVNPSDRYVLCAPGTNRYRLAADRSGFDNLTLAGDWVYNSLNYGCIEAAVMTGLRASRAICGYPKQIIGDYDQPTHETNPANAGGTMPEKPLFIVRGGEQCYTPPTMQAECHYYGYLLEADATALQALIDKDLNQPARGAVSYHALVPRVILGFADIRKGYCLTPPDSQIGWMPEIDVAFWVPVARVKKVAGVNFIERILWYMPYVFVDTPVAVILGREIWGFHKQLASFNIPKSPADPAQFTMDGIAIPRYDPSLEIVNQRMLEVTRIDAPQVGELERVWGDVKEGFKDVMSMFLGGGTITLPGLGLVAEVFEFLTHHDMPIVFLKQFRDAVDGSRACYQAIIEANASMTTYRTGGWLSGQYQVSIAPLQSHPIARDLGLSGDRLQSIAAFYANYDFTMNEGEEIWRAR